MGDTTKIFDHEIRLVRIETILEDNTIDIKETLNLIKNGLSTQVALNGASIRRLWLVTPVFISILLTGISFAVRYL
jgi:hypothetical protein